MIKELAQSNENVLAFEITDKVTLEEENEWIARFDKILEKKDKISVMVILGENTSWGTWAGIEDVKWIFKNYKKFEKVALVSERWVWKWLVAIDSQFAKMMGIEGRHFEAEESKKAWEWLNSSSRAIKSDEE